MWMLYAQLLGGQKRYGLVWTVIINPPELPINDESRNDAHIYKHRCAAVLGHIQGCHIKQWHGNLVMHQKVSLIKQVEIGQFCNLAQKIN